MVIADELTRSDLIKQPPVQIGGGRLVSPLPSLPRPRPLFLHQARKFPLVHLHLLLLGDLHDQFEGESVCVVKSERHLSREDLALVQVLHLPLQNGMARLQGAQEAVLLAGDHLQDQVVVVDDLRIGVSQRLGRGRGQPGHQETLISKLPSVSHCSADQSSQDIASSLVGGHHTVGDEEGHGATVIGQNAQGRHRKAGFLRRALRRSKSRPPALRA